ncbi:MAG: hypothetical protein HY925_15605 [Elusimicrobia bacterium]|nr:hypothetical protein [Elusimicrobiota bacterium]
MYRDHLGRAQRRIPAFWAGAFALAMLAVALVTVGIDWRERERERSRDREAAKMLLPLARPVALGLKREPPEDALGAPGEAAEDGPLTFTEFMDYLGNLSEETGLKPAASLFGAEFRKVAALERIREDFQRRAAAGEKPKATAFIRALRKAPEFRKLASKFLAQPGSAALVSVLQGAAAEPKASLALAGPDGGAGSSRLHRSGTPGRAESAPVTTRDWDSDPAPGARQASVPAGFPAPGGAPAVMDRAKPGPRAEAPAALAKPRDVGRDKPAEPAAAEESRLSSVFGPTSACYEYAAGTCCFDGEGTLVHADGSWAAGSPPCSGAFKPTGAVCATLSRGTCCFEPVTGKVAFESAPRACEDEGSPCLGAVCCREVSGSRCCFDRKGELVSGKAGCAG